MADPAKEWHKCSICGSFYQGFGHNAEPINGGRCCDICNDIKVVPTRITNFFAKQTPDQE